MLIVGAAVYGKGAKDLKHYEELCPEADDGTRYCGNGPEAIANKEAGNEARTRKVVGGVVAGVGVATLAGGLIWYFMQPRSAVATGSLQRPLVRPSVAPGFAGVALSGAF